MNVFKEVTFIVLPPVVIVLVAPPPNVSIQLRLHPLLAKLLHGLRKRVEERRFVRRVKINKRTRPAIKRNRLVRLEQPVTVLQVLVIHVIKLPGGKNVIKRRHLRVLGVVRAELPQLRRVFRVHPFGAKVSAVLGVAVEDAARELFAVGEADRVRSDESHHLLDGQTSRAEDGDDAVHRHVGAS